MIALIKGILFVLLMQSSVFAATYYVSPIGNNANDGSESTPWATLSYALAEISAGDTINLTAGTHSGDANTSVNGTSGSRISITGAGVDSTIYSGELTIDCPYYTISGISFTDQIPCVGSGCANIIFDTIEIYNAPYGIYMQASSGTFPDDNIVRNSEFHHMTENGMVVLHGSDSSVYNCTFHDSNGNDALRVFGDNHVIYSNTFYNIISPTDTNYISSSTTSTAIGIGEKTFTIDSGKSFSENDYLTIFSAGATSNLMTGRVVSYSGTTLVINVLSTGGSGTYTDWTVRFESYGNHADIIQTFKDSNNKVAYNLSFYKNNIYNCTSQFGNLEADVDNNYGGTWYIYNNLLKNSRIQLNNYLNNVNIFNNTFIDSVGFTTGLMFRSSSDRGNANNGSVKNNLIIQFAGTEAYAFAAELSGCAGDYNIYTSASDGSLSNMTANTHETNGGVAPSELFTSATADLTLKTGSPAIDAGTDLSAYFATDYAGNTRSGTWDIGAYEYGASSTPTHLSPASGRRVGGGSSGGTFR